MAVGERDQAERADTEVGTTASEGRETEHALRPTEAQRTSMHPEERQRLTGNSHTIEPLRGKQEMEDGTVSRRYRRMNDE